MAPGSQAASAEGREELGRRLAEAGLPMFGVLPRDPLLASVRLDEIQAALQARAVAGGAQHPDVHFDKVSLLLAVAGLIGMLFTAPTNFLMAKVDMKVVIKAPSLAETSKSPLAVHKALAKALCADMLAGGTQACCINRLSATVAVGSTKACS